MEKSLLDHAYEFVSAQKEPVTFAQIWAYVVEQSGLNADEAAAKISRFFTNLQLDGRFVNLGENTWDLRIRHTFDKVHIDMNDVYNDVETSEEDAEEAQDEDYKEYKENLEDEEDADADDADKATESGDEEL